MRRFLSTAHCGCSHFNHRSKYRMYTIHTLSRIVSNMVGNRPISSVPISVPNLVGIQAEGSLSITTYFEPRTNPGRWECFSDESIV